MFRAILPKNICLFSVAQPSSPGEKKGYTFIEAELQYF